MSFTINWLIENEVMFTRYYDKVTADELAESIAKTHEMMNESPRPIVHAIIDVGDVTEPVPMSESLNVVRNAGENEKTGWTITLRERSQIIKMTSSFARTVFKIRTRNLNTMHEAIEHLKQFDSAISWDKMDQSYLPQELRINPPKDEFA